MHYPILRNKIVSKAIILVLIVAIATPPVVFAETQEECEERKAKAIADAQAQIIAAKIKVAIATLKVAIAQLTYNAILAQYKACPNWNFAKKALLLIKLFFAKRNLDDAKDELQDAMDELKAAQEALKEALAIECDCEE